MSQRLVITEIEGSVFPELGTSMPDKDELLGMVYYFIEEGIVPEDKEYYETQSTWYDIGSGESGTETFFSDEELLAWCESGILLERIKAVSEHDVDQVMSDSYTVHANELEELF